MSLERGGQKKVWAYASDWKFRCELIEVYLFIELFEGLQWSRIIYHRVGRHNPPEICRYQVKSSRSFQKEYFFFIRVRLARHAKRPPPSESAPSPSSSSRQSILIDLNVCAI